jgi:hypothetical protein
MRTGFKATHAIKHDGETIRVKVVRDGGFTRQDWDAGHGPDYERQSDGSWTFRGKPLAGVVRRLPKRSTTTRHPVALSADVLAAARADAAEDGISLEAWLERAVAYRITARRLGWRVHQPGRNPPTETSAGTPPGPEAGSPRPARRAPGGGKRGGTR